MTFAFDDLDPARRHLPCAGGSGLRIAVERLRAGRIRVQYMQRHRQVVEAECDVRMILPEYSPAQIEGFPREARGRFGLALNLEERTKIAHVGGDFRVVVAD